MDDEAVQAAMQHEPEVIQARNSRLVRGRCTCGWLGPEQARLEHADEDVSAHLRAVLPDDAPGSIYR